MSGCQQLISVQSLSRVQLFATAWPAAYQASPSMGFSRQEYWSGSLFHTLHNTNSLELFLIVSKCVFVFFYINLHLTQVQPLHFVIYFKSFLISYLTHCGYLVTYLLEYPISICLSCFLVVMFNLFFPLPFLNGYQFRRIEQIQIILSGKTA